MIGVMYRPNFEEHFEELLDKINKENKLYFLMGDFNIDMLKINQSYLFYSE